MGKDQSGKFKPDDGKPSITNKVEAPGTHTKEPGKTEQNLDISDEYISEDELSPGIPLRHRNRQTSKGTNQYKGKQNKDDGKRSKGESLHVEESVTIAEEIPGRLTKEIFAEIAAYKSSCCVSLYLPIQQAGVSANGGLDVSNFKKVLQHVEVSLKEKNIPEFTIQSMLKPGYDLMTQDEFWSGLSKGLAVYIADGYFKYIKLPVSPDQKVIYEPSFYVSPLIPVISSSEYFYLLVISKSQVKLFRADAFGMEHIKVEGLPAPGLNEVKRTTEQDAPTPGMGTTEGTGGANFYGVGGGTPGDKTSIGTYFEFVDDILFKQIFNKENVPLVLAGVEYLIPIYKSACDYHNVWPEFLAGSYEYENTSKLHEQVMEIMRPYFKERTQKALNQYGNRSATQLTSSVLSDVISASYYGRVSHLFVLKGSQVWGTFDEMDAKLNLHSSSDHGGDDLIDNAVEKTLLTGGEVFILDKEEMPADSDVAAIFRY